MAHDETDAQHEEWYRYALALEASQEGFWDLDLVAGRLWGSRRWQALTGITTSGSALSAWVERVHPHDKDAFAADLRAIREGELPTLRNEHRVLDREGQWRWVLARGLASQDADGRVTHIAGSLSDKTEERTADALTGLPNRLCFIDRLERRMERARLRADWDFAVVALVLEGFNRVRESLGSAGTDRLLMETALRLQSVLPEPSLAAHFSGAEFLVLLEGIHADQEAAYSAAAVAAALGQPFAWQGSRVVPQLALGIAQADAACAHPEELIDRAESALGQARRRPSPGITFYAAGMRERARNKLAMEADLERAITGGELTMFYQPEVDLQTHGIVGFEALVRWRHPRLGLLPPSEFIPLAEETGLILPLGEWTLRETCRQMAQWRDCADSSRRELRVSVNLSPLQFAQDDLARRVQQAIEDSRLDPSSLRLEVTESSVIADADAAVETMRDLGRIGVGLHMDDFGVGYSSLQYLRDFPFDTLKIDRSFIYRIAHDRDSQKIVHSILELARAIGLDVVAEGIEQADQLETLKLLGCPRGQGYYFSRPLEASAVPLLLRIGKLQPAQA